ncbi:hypothetical protein Bhyg_12814 [Pseudolycoriella hygida]|uniref:Uncharacterized protein n=1 Tax=Pseudolycoriella hygida TaxID=35572 RepID=A0A9Q0RZP4_9DIPT|nr:hypothetical protein Bhyg_12814 [Pseudolycoriella hygida]
MQSGKKLTETFVHQPHKHYMEYLYQNLNNVSIVIPIISGMKRIEYNLGKPTDRLDLGRNRWELALATLTPELNSIPAYTECRDRNQLSL